MVYSGMVNPFPNKPWFLHVCSISLLKTLWEKEKLLLTSNFSFSHSVFYPFEEFSTIFIKFEVVVCILSQFARVQNLLYGKEINEDLFPVEVDCISAMHLKPTFMFLGLKIRFDQDKVQSLQLQ